MSIKYLSSLLSLFLLIMTPIYFAIVYCRTRKIKLSLGYIAMGGVFYAYIMKVGTQLILPAFKDFSFMQKVLESVVISNIVIVITELIFTLFGYYVFYCFALREKADEKAIVSFIFGIIIATVIFGMLSTAWGNFSYYRAENNGTLEDVFSKMSYTSEQIDNLKKYYNDISASQCCLPGIMIILVISYHYSIACMLLYRKKMPRLKNNLHILGISILFAFMYYLMPLISAPITVVLVLIVSLVYYLIAEKENSLYRKEIKNER